MLSQQSSQMVAISCPLCGSEQHQFERSLKGFTLVRCRNCQLVFVNPQLSMAAQMAIYQEKRDVGKLIKLYKDFMTPSVLAGYDRKLQTFEVMLGRQGKILDFACAAGYFLERATARGWCAHGVDIGEWAGEAAKERGVRNVHVGYLSEICFPKNHFDVIYAAQVLEHLQDLLGTLAELRRILKPGGILYVDVPNYNTIPIMLGKDDFYLNDPPQHINFFTPQTLKALLQKATFESIQLSTEGGMKWENLIGRPIISDIADSYRTTHNAPMSIVPPLKFDIFAKFKYVLRPFVSSVLYGWWKVGINLVGFSRRPTTDG